MLVERIISRQNPLVKRFRRVRRGDEPHLALLEGVRLVSEALAAGARFETIAFTSDLDATERGRALKGQLQEVPCRGAMLTPHVMEYLSDTGAPQGIAAIIDRPCFQISDLFGPPPELIVVADSIQDPGNLGTIIRSAEAAGASGLVTTVGTTGAYGPKCLRASMGSAIRLPIVANAGRSRILEECSKRGLRLLVTHALSRDPRRPARPSIAHTQVDFTRRVALILGGEAEGVSAEFLGKADELVYIPMAPGLESLNVAAAAAIVLYEAARQRGFLFRGLATDKRAHPDES